MKKRPSRYDIKTSCQRKGIGIYLPI